MADDPKPGDPGAEIIALVEQIKATDPKAFSEALHKGAIDHYNVMFRVGYGTSKFEFEPKLTAAEAATAEALKGITERDGRIEELAKKAPDMAAMQTKYEAALVEQEKKLTAQIDEQTSIAKSTLQAGFWSNFNRTLVADHGIDKDYAEMISQKTDVRKRITWLDDGSQKIYQDDGTTPHPLSPGQHAYEVLAKDLAKGVPAKFVNDKKPNNTGFSGGGDLSKLGQMSDTDKEKALADAWSGRL